MIGPTAWPVRDPDSEGVPDTDEGGVVASLLEQRESRERQRFELLSRALASIASVVGGDRPGECFAGRIALSGGTVGGMLKHQRRSAGVIDEGGLRQVGLEQNVEPQRRRQRQCALEQPGRRAAVFAPQRSPASGGEPFVRACCEIVRRSREFPAVGDRLLEVVSDDLVQLDERAVAVEPIGEALVQFGPEALGKSVVGGVPDQQVAEAERVLAHHLGLIRTEEIAPHKSGQRAVT
jgi:hypothetical protein